MAFMSDMDPRLNCKCGNEVVPLKCSKCDKPLDLLLCKYDLKRDYYCYEHCPEHEWQVDYDTPEECKYCGVIYEWYLLDVIGDLESELDLVKSSFPSASSAHYSEVIPKGYEWIWCVMTTENYPNGIVLEHGEIGDLMEKYRESALKDEVIFARDLVKKNED